jgi:hypothetical protein
MTVTFPTAGWKRVVAHTLVWVGVTFASWYAALWLFPLPSQGTFTGPEAEALSRAYTLWWWKFFALFVVVCALVYEVAPRLWRWWFGGANGEVAG